jgi:hypothetical protein
MCRSSGAQRSGGLGNPGFAPGAVIRASSGGVIRDREPWRLLKARSPTSWIADPRAPPARLSVPRSGGMGTAPAGCLLPDDCSDLLARRPFEGYRTPVEGCRRRLELPPVGGTAEIDEHHPSASLGMMR